MKYYSIGEFSKLINVTIQTLRNWDKTGKLKPHHVSEANHRYYSQTQLNQYLGLQNKKNEKKFVIGYCRVLSNKQKDDLIRQEEYVKQYMIAKGYQYKIVKDIGSGINYNKKGLKELIGLITSYQVSKVVIFYKDRLVRFGYELIEYVCELFDCEIEIIDNTEKTDEQELVEDLIQIVTVFSCRLQDKRANKAKKILRQLKEDDTDD